MDNVESEPFVKKSRSTHSHHSQSQQEAHQPIRAILLVHLALFPIYVLATILIVRFHISSTCENVTKGPLEDVEVFYVQRTFINLTDNIYAGEPSTEIDHAWDKLLDNMNIRVTAEELAVQNQQSVQLPEGGGYLAWIGAAHEIHCIKMLREWIHRTHYHPNLTDAEYEHWRLHADHCLDLLRQSALCRADTSLTTFIWNETKSKPMFDAAESQHTCVDWERLQSSLDRRRIDMREMHRLRNPLIDATERQIES